MRKIKECTFNQLYTFFMNNYIKILSGDISFPLTLAVFLNNPHNKALSSKEKREYTKQIMSEIKPELLNTYINIDGEDYFDYD